MDNTEPTYKRYRCWLHSAPGMWSAYDGYVDVFSPDEDEVFTRAVRQLGWTSFPDRRGLGLDAWRLDRVELLAS